MAGLSILVVNAGSTSLKLSVVDDDDSSATVGALAEAPSDLAAVAHRVVHGGARFREPVVIDDGVRQELEGLTELAPLHNAPALAAIDEARRALPDVPHVAVFDTVVPRHDPGGGVHLRAAPPLARGVGDPPLRLPRVCRSRGRPSGCPSRVSSSATSAAAAR